MSVIPASGGGLAGGRAQDPTICQRLVHGPLRWGPQDPADAIAAVLAALDAGVDRTDTALGRHC